MSVNYISHCMDLNKPLELGMRSYILPNLLWDSLVHKMIILSLLKRIHPSICWWYTGNLFHIKDLGSLHYFPRIKVKKSSSGIFLCQTKYILDLLKKSNMDGAKPCTTPLSTFSLDHESVILSDPTDYRSLVGGLQYLTWYKTDFSFAVNLVCQFIHQPRESHLQALKHILRYLKGTLELGLWFPTSSKSLRINAYLMQIGQTIT